MEFTIGSVMSPRTDTSEPLKRDPAQRVGRPRNRRRRKQDRRRNVREGIFVSLSAKEDRRRPGDRRESSI